MDGETRAIEQLKELPPYARIISTTMVALGKAVELALNLRDRAVLQEMRQVATEMFNAADEQLEAFKSARVQ